MFREKCNLKKLLPAAACALVLILCYFLIRPYAEIGINDDWVYIKDALKVAQTGHISYSGNETPILGWQLYLGAFFIKLFGFSFTAVRVATVIEAVATVFVLERAFEIAGLNLRNATLATMTFVLSPLFLPIVCTFMTDVSGVLCVVVCLYMCLRALQARSANSAAAWISLAALVNAVGGTARQIAWLGVLVMVPSTLWLLRRNRRVLILGCISWIAGVGIVAASMHWFAKQPYSIAAPIFSRHVFDLVKNFGRAVLGGAGSLMLFALPVLLFFAGYLRSWWRRVAAAVAAVLAMAPIHWLKIDKWPANVAFDAITTPTFERLNAIAARAFHLDAARYGLRMLLTGAVVFGLLCLALCGFERTRKRSAAQPEAAAVSWQKLGVIVGPLSAAYLVLLALQPAIFDRYFLPLLVILLLVLTRFYQERVQAKLPLASALPIVLFGAFSVAATHDKFALYRGYVSAIGEVRTMGIPATAILGPWEFGGWTEVETAGYINDSRIRVPQGAYVPQPEHVLPANCTPSFFGSLEAMPALHPVYAVSSDPQECGGQVAYPPVTYRTWIAPRVNSIYAVRLPPSFPH
jgi:hypothetical protein